jgi:hypothetical protein
MYLAMYVHAASMGCFCLNNFRKKYRKESPYGMRDYSKNVEKFGDISKVTRSSEISPIGRLFSFGQFFKIT